MLMMSNDLRFGVGETPDGKRHLVLNLGGEFRTNAEIGAYMKDYGEKLVLYGAHLAELRDDEDEE